MNNLRRLGISIYPSSQNVKDMIEYIDLAHKYGFTRIFSSMLEIDVNTKTEVLNKFKTVFEHAKKLGFDICLDVSPRIFTLLGITATDLSLFKELNATTLRLDMPMDAQTEAQMTFNEFGLNIEINMSNNTAYAENILTYKPLKDKLICCHNFYPQKLSGLDYDFFIATSKRHKVLGLRTAAFVSSKHGKNGPWSITDGLPTLEMHRDMPISTQAKHLWATGLIDDVIIGNAFASEEELKSLSKIDRYKITLSVELMPSTSEVEKEIISLNNHFRRGDINKYSIRSTMSRVHYKQHPFPEHDNNQPQEKGNIYIGNDAFGIYKGELQLILNGMPVDSRKNCVAKVVEDDLFLIDFIDSWDKFKFIIEEKHGK